MPAVIDVAKCQGCGDCVDACPTECITMNEDDKAVVDIEECSDCASCVDACPEEAISME